MKETIAVLITCHNRREKTLKCLQSLFQCKLPENYKLDVYLVDDGSTDNTTNAIIASFPIVNLIQGTGELFWNQGMLLAWKSAYKIKDYDFYFWLNDDTYLEEYAIVELVECYFEALKKDSIPAIITGVCMKSTNSQYFSYGGRTDDGPIIPNGKLQACKYINGNVVLLHQNIFHSIGYLSAEYTHTFGDYDYGLRAIQAGFNSYVTKTFIASCFPNDGIPSWCNPKIPLHKRLNQFYSPKGLNIREYNLFNRKFKKKKWIILAFKAYLKTFFPLYYNKLSNL